MNATIKNFSKTLLVSITIFSMIIISSCSKDDEMIPVETKLYLSKTTFANIGSYNFNYDNQNKLSNVVFVSTNESANASYTYFVKSFDGDKIKTATFDYVNPSRQDIDLEIRYNSTGKKIGELYYNTNTTILDSGSIIEYVSNTQIKVSRIDEANQVINYTLYSYDSTGTNLIDIKIYNSSDELTFTQTYSDYDTKLNYTNLNPNNYYTGISSKNNHSTVTNIPVTGASSTTTYVYEYDNENYVTKRTSQSGAINTYEYINK